MALNINGEKIYNAIATTADIGGKVLEVCTELCDVVTIGVAFVIQF